MSLSPGVNARMLEHVTPVILTYNEQANIERSLSALSWAKRVVVLDSFSDDATELICGQYNNVEFHQRAFDQHATQWNAALDIARKQNTETWALALDADHILSSDFIAELSTLPYPPQANGYWATFRYLINGKPLRGSLYPPVLSLFNADVARYSQDGHTQRVQVSEPHAFLNASIDHDDRKGWRRWFQSQQSYAKQEAKKLADEYWRDLSWPDRLRKSALAPLAVLPYTLLIKGLAFNGWAGWVYSAQRFIAEVLLQWRRITRLFK